MAITTTAYIKFAQDLASGVHDLVADTHKAALLGPGYTPNYVGHTLYDDVSAAELPDGTATPGGYPTGGIALTGKTFNYDATERTATVDADALSLTALTGTVRYVAVYRTDSVDRWLVGLIDLGADTAYSNEPFDLEFPSGVIVLQEAA